MGSPSPLPRRLKSPSPSRRALRRWTPYDASDTLSRTVSSSFYEGLFSLDDQNRPVPALATGYEVSDDGLVYTMKLREGVKFQDGTDFDANAVKINFDRLLDKANNLSRRGFQHDRQGRSGRPDDGSASRSQMPFLGVRLPASPPARPS